MRVIAVVAGLVLVVGVFLGMVDTLISTRLRVSRRRRFSTWLPAVTWPLFRAVSQRARVRSRRRGESSERSEARREAVLSAYPPLVLLALIAFWVGFQVLGWGLIWWGSGVIADVTRFGESLYYSGVVYFTVGFGEIVPAASLGRLLSMVEAFSGVLFIALTVGYLPSLYGAFSERERELLLIDDGGEARITPLSLMVERLDGSTDLDDLDATMGEWERWVAMVLETHTSHPLLAYFRSQHAGQSWVTAIEHLDAPRGFWGHQIGVTGAGPGATTMVGRDPGSSAGTHDEQETP